MTPRKNPSAVVGREAERLWDKKRGSEHPGRGAESSPPKSRAAACLEEKVKELSTRMETETNENKSLGKQGI